MPVVSLIISEVLDGSQVSDPLDGGGTGVDLGQVATKSYAPLVNKTLNQGAQDLFVRHDGANEIYSVVTFIQPYGTETGFAYGGASSAANDFARLKALGNASGSSKNNSDNLSGGLWIDMDWNAGDSTRFDQLNFPSLVKIYGDNNTDGISLASAFQVAAEAMVYGVGSVETQPSAPVAGKIGPQSTPTVLGDNAHLKLRIYLPASYGNPGKTQVEYCTSYVYTS